MAASARARRRRAAVRRVRALRTARAARRCAKPVVVVSEQRIVEAAAVLCQAFAVLARQADVALQRWRRTRRTRPPHAPAPALLALGAGPGELDSKLCRHTRGSLEVAPRDARDIAVQLVQRRLIQLVQQAAKLRRRGALVGQAGERPQHLGSRRRALPGHHHELVPLRQQLRRPPSPPARTGDRAAAVWAARSKRCADGAWPAPHRGDATRATGGGAQTPSSARRALDAQPARLPARGCRIVTGATRRRELAARRCPAAIVVACAASVALVAGRGSRPRSPAASAATPSTTTAMAAEPEAEQLTQLELLGRQRPRALGEHRSRLSRLLDRRPAVADRSRARNPADAACPAPVAQARDVRTAATADTRSRRRRRRAGA